MTKLADDITVILAGGAITLRPSLRFAIRLERRPGSFAALVQEIMDGSLSAACDIIGDHVRMTPDMQDAILAALPSLRGPLIAYVMACAGIDPDDAPANDNRGQPRKSVPFDEYLIGLYRVGTGWLGWTPHVTLNATPAEIIEAQKGRTELLRAVFGGGEEEPSNLPLDDKVKTAFGSFTTTIVKRRKAG